MKQVSSWVAAIMVGIWGMLGIFLVARAVIRENSPDELRLAASILLSMIVIAFTTLAFYLRRRVARRRQACSLEEVRRQSRQRLAGEPIEGTYVVTPSRKRRREDHCREEVAAHAGREQQAARADAQKQQAKETQE